MTMKSVLLLCLLQLPCLLSVPPWNVIGPSRMISLKQGPIVGLRVAPMREVKLKDVEIFLGIPYAAPPVGNLRFMPPGSPPPWSKRRIADSMGPVCPQVLPQLDENPRKTSSGRVAYLKRLLPYLQNQSEDCLYLNVYVPVNNYHHEDRKVPVIVFVHGESFLWNSGNPYDGSIFASYSDVIVVTINFRLGILGFLKLELDGRTMTNFGLLDQIAALQWVKDNIESFGGDRESVTLIGHHTGAVAVNYLMLSPVAQAVDGLFHRAILMSGSALADWAEVRNPEQVTLRVAEGLNCPRSGQGLVLCLRRKRVADLLALPLGPAHLGPSVDGHVVPNTPKKVMSEYTDLFSRYDLMCGVTELESYHMLDSVSLAHGMLDVERDKLLKEYFRSTFQKHPEMAQTKATAVYMEHAKGKSTAENIRDATLDLLSDAMVVVPVVMTAIYHSSKPAHGATTFMYVFKHKSTFSEFRKADKSVHGEELAYVFGVPLDGPRFLFQGDYNLNEKLLSEAVMTMWSNFARTGDPNKPKKHAYHTQGQREWGQYDVHWPAFDRSHQGYYNLAVHPRVEFQYRDQFVRFWNEFLPKFLVNPSYPTTYENKNHIPPWVTEDPNTHRMWVPPLKPPDVMKTTPIFLTDEGEKYKHDRNNKFDKPIDPPIPTEADVDGQISTASSFTFSIIIFVGLCFLFINVISFLFICYQKKKLRKEIGMSARYRCGSSPSLPEVPEERYGKEPDKGEIKSILKSSEGSYERMKVKEKLSRWPGMYRQGSSSTVTMDPHTKVTEWIAQEIVHRCSPNFLRRNRHTADKVSESDRVSAATTSKLARGSGSGSHKKVKKVSVAVDATPSTRSASVLKQIPIELTKSLDDGQRKLGSGRHPGRPILQRSEAIDDDDDGEQYCGEPVSVHHGHSYSDPVDMDTKGPSDEKSLKTFEPLPAQRDINVTCRDDTPRTGHLTPEEALDNIKRRNFPKVLPDFPEFHSDQENEKYSKAVKRYSMPAHCFVTSENNGQNSDKDAHNKESGSKKVPPPPPPRISTLGRKQHRSEQQDKSIVRRQEPKVIIKPTLSDPNKQKKNNPQIPRVKHTTVDIEAVDSPTPVHERTPKDMRRGMPSPRMGVGAHVKIQPVKKTVSTETQAQIPELISSGAGTTV